MLPNKLTIEKTLKSKDTEEFLDIIFYRPLGYVSALIFNKIGFTPNGITILSIFVGVIAGHLFYYNNLTINIIGIAFLVWADILDSADGQLARMMNKKSMYGRILDGFGENLWYISIYIHLCLRLINDGQSYTVFLVAIVCGISHSLQSAVADYYRNFYLFFVYDKKRSEISKSQKLQKGYQELSWSKNFARKFLMRVYINYTIEQEFLSANSLKLLNYISLMYNDQVPTTISVEFKKQNKKLIKYCNILTSNTRMIVLFISILAGNLWLFFIFEATVLNILLVYVVFKHEKNSKIIMYKTISINSGGQC